MKNITNTKTFRRVTSVGVLSIALLGSVVFLTGCSAGFNPEMTDGLADKRHESKATLVFREYKSSIYIVEIEGKRYLHNTAGGLLPLE